MLKDLQLSSKFSSIILGGSSIPNLIISIVLPRRYIVTCRMDFDDNSIIIDCMCYEKIFSKIWSVLKHPFAY